MVDLAAHLRKLEIRSDKFKDKYESALKALVKRKAAGKTIEVPEAKEEESKVIDLMDALKQSLGRRKAGEGGKERPSDPRPAAEA